jgi:hypothetical protein
VPSTRKHGVKRSSSRCLSSADQDSGRRLADDHQALPALQLHSLCPKEAKGWVKGVNAEPMVLVNGKERLTLTFDCKACEMHVMGKAKKGRTISILQVAH